MHQKREREKEKRAIIEKKITLYIKIRWKRIKNREERKERDTAQNIGYLFIYILYNRDKKEE